MQGLTYHRPPYFGYRGGIFVFLQPFLPDSGSLPLAYRLLRSVQRSTAMHTTFAANPRASIFLPGIKRKMGFQRFFFFFSVGPLVRHFLC